MACPADPADRQESPAIWLRIIVGLVQPATPRGPEHVRSLAGRAASLDGQIAARSYSTTTLAGTPGRRPSRGQEPATPERPSTPAVARPQPDGSAMSMGGGDVGGLSRPVWLRKAAQDRGLLTQLLTQLITAGDVASRSVIVVGWSCAITGFSPDGPPTTGGWPC